MYQKSMKRAQSALAPIPLGPIPTPLGNGNLANLRRAQGQTDQPTGCHFCLLCCALEADCFIHFVLCCVPKSRQHNPRGTRRQPGVLHIFCNGQLEKATGCTYVVQTPKVKVQMAMMYVNKVDKNHKFEEEDNHMTTREMILLCSSLWGVGKYNLLCLVSGVC